MRKRITGALVAVAATAVLVAPAAPAAADTASDCIIMGPAYVADAIDCAFYILEHLA